MFGGQTSTTTLMGSEIVRDARKPQITPTLDPYTGGSTLRFPGRGSIFTLRAISGEDANGGGRCTHKWPEIFVIKNTTAEGLPDQLVSDNGPQFTSETFKKFGSENGFRHFTGAPHHPSINGLAEWLVQNFKKSVKADKSGRSLQHKLDRFLLSYCTSPHTTTEVSPAQLLLGLNVKTSLDLTKPDVRREVDKKLLQSYNSTLRSFKLNQSLWAHNYRIGPRWVHATVMKRTGPVL